MGTAISDSQLQSPRRVQSGHLKCSPFRMIIVIIISLAYISWRFQSYIFPVHQPSSDVRFRNETQNIDWDSIQPSEQLQWTPCLERFFCARLTVPMDYTRPLVVSQAHPKVHIALMMLAGVNHSTPRTFANSPLMLNPGGPGGSGINQLKRWGDRARAIVGDDEDVIGFDPRGIGESTPQADCFTFPSRNISSQVTSLQGAHNRMIWAATGLQAGAINLGNDDALVNLDGRGEMLAKLCKAKDDLHGKDSILRYVDTMSVIKDMASILDAWGYWIASNGTDTLKTAIKESQLPDTPVKLRYWGFSYGSLLGSTFAAVYPHRIQRVVLDGILEAETYVGFHWKAHIQHADTVLASFFHYCIVAGEDCHLYRPNDTSSNVEMRFHSIMRTLKQTAITFISPQTMMPIIITHEMVKEFVFDAAMFAPMKFFPLLAQLLDGIDKGDTAVIFEVLQPDDAFDIGIEEAGLAVVCTDKQQKLRETIPGLKIIFDKLYNQTYFADVWMKQMMGCHHWNVSAAGAQLPFHPGVQSEQINTSFPLLFISNSADPVGPIQGGLNMALKFRDAGFIEQKSEGHCSTSTLSLCTINKVRSYFRDGIVPPAPILGETLSEGLWDRCERDERPWKPFKEEEWKEAKLSSVARGDERSMKTIEDETAVLQAWKEIQQETRRWKSHELA